MSPPPPPARPARSPIGLIIGLIAGVMALLLLVCVCAGYFAFRAIRDRPAPPVTQASSSPSQTPRPTRQTFSTTVDTGRFQLQVEIDPARTGNNLVHLYAYTRTGAPQMVQEWKVTASLPDAGIDRLDMPVLRISENHATGTISLPAPGRWQFQFTLRTSEGEQDSATAQVPIK